MHWFVLLSFRSFCCPFLLDFSHVFTQTCPCLLSWVFDHSSSFVSSFMARLSDALCLGSYYGRFGHYVVHFGFILQFLLTQIRPCLLY